MVWLKSSDNFAPYHEMYAPLPHVSAFSGEVNPSRKKKEKIAAWYVILGMNLSF